jgi:hypothetical protein
MKISKYLVIIIFIVFFLTVLPSVVVTKVISPLQKMITSRR